MKRSIAYLPKRKQDDIHYLVKSVLERLPQTEMIILYGSYATGEYVDRDERIEFGVRTVYMSDYDILVATHGIGNREAGNKLEAVENKYYTDPDSQTPVQFINEDIKKLNQDLSEGRYFYTQVKKEGILLYDSGRFRLARRRKLRYREIKQQAEEYFKEKYHKAQLFFDQAIFMYNKKEYAMSSFDLHQTCENLFQGVRLTFTLESFKQHNLAKLLAAVRKYSDELEKIFPRKTTEEKRLFKLLKDAYVEARYNPGFSVTKEDIDSLMSAVEQLFELVKRLCDDRIKKYDEMID
ncbi:MAG: HEPN domain-containing protein [Mangrovibacterium sp.]